MTNKQEEEVLVTRRGQTTIPSSIRKKLNIREGTRLRVETKDGKVILSKIPSTFDLAGKGKLTRRQAIRLLDQMREQE